MSTDASDSHDKKPVHPSHDNKHGHGGGASILNDHALDEVPLHDPDLHVESSYGRTDPASIAALPSLELHEPDLKHQESDELPEPDMSPAAFEAMEDDLPAVTLEMLSEPVPVEPIDLLLAHIAQVGLIDADLWEEQMKPRIDQLHVDIKEVHVQLDDLETAGRKTKKS